MMILLEGLLGTASALSLEAGGPIHPSDPITIGIRSGSESFQVIQGSSGESVAGLALVCTPSRGSPHTVITDRSGRIDLTLLAAGTWQLALQLPEEGTLSFARPDEMQIPVNGMFPPEVTPIGVTRLILGPPKRAERPAPTAAIEQERERQQRERARLAVLAESVARMRTEIDARELRTGTAPGPRGTARPDSVRPCENLGHLP